MELRTLADVKRACKKGTILTVVYKDGKTKTRPISVVQTNAIAFNDRGSNSWLFWQKADYYTIHKNGFSTYWNENKTEDNLIATYTFK